MARPQVTMLLVLIAAALAGPARCVATWSGPADGCALRGEVKATAAGPNEKAADRAARKQLDEVVDLSVAAQRARIPTLTAADFASCRATAREEAYVHCFADDALAATSLCFVELSDPECWTGQVQQVEGVGWQALASGRDALCKAVDERLVSLAWSDLATRRAVCAASCQAQATVRCLGD